HRGTHGLPFRRRFDAGHRNDAAVGLESVYCLGQCALSPALMINGTLHAKVTPQKFDALLDAAEVALRGAQRAEEPV
ncbi:NAD(P)H-dependent oxidoreductase subunit E, partial [Paraburkholderia madseniana]|uniref:NAD(P)H-dependent oxidoreductase subunit E n=1 Tax=Paraburkholderia madseniana TaxID=2599607 RepID=UPI0038B7901F